jgi:hypothetical protein
MRPFRPQLFLYRALAGIFIVQAGMLGFALWRCAEVRPEDANHALAQRCPTLGDRFEATGNVAIATVLSLLTGKFIDDTTK